MALLTQLNVVPNHGKQASE